jgi:hypothetical protein
MGARDSVPSTSRGWRRLVQVRGRLGLKVTPALAVLLSVLLVGPAVAEGATSYMSTVPKETLPFGATAPSNGDQNPYGIVTVPKTVGSLRQGDLLVSNFNNNQPNGGEQGTGTTIVQIPPGGSNRDPGTASVFARFGQDALAGGVGLTTALAVTSTGDVFVGDLPTSDGTSATAKAGGILVVNSRGHLIETISGGPLNGPWDMTSTEHGDITTLYVTNVLNGTVKNSPNVVDEGTVLRMEFLTVPDAVPMLLNATVIARGFPERTDPAALVVGPTGVALGSNGTLYVADTQGNRIAAIPDAATRQNALGGGGITVATGDDLMGPLGLTLAPNGNLLAANGGNGNIIELSPTGAHVATVTADDSSAPGGAGVLFGLTVSPFNNDLYFVDDGMNELGVFSSR